MPDNARTTEMSDEPPTEAPTQADIVSEGKRVVDLATAAGLTLRLLGGVAVRLTCPSAGEPPLARSYGDLDFAAQRREGRALRDLLEKAGYTPERHFNALHGDKRLLYVDEPRERKVDVFLGAFRMCHTLDLEARLSLSAWTLAPADLLLTKLQIVQLNTKDAQDALAILADHELAEYVNATHAGDVIDVGYIATLCGHDWGWYTTVSDNLTQVEQVGGELPPSDAIARATQRIATLRNTLEQTSKSLSWRMRSAVGRRVQWYEEPEEIRQ